MKLRATLIFTRRPRKYVAWCMRGILELTRSAVKTGEIDVQALEPVLCVLLDNGTELEDNIRRARSEIEELDPPRRGVGQRGYGADADRWGGVMSGLMMFENREIGTQ